MKMYDKKSTNVVEAVDFYSDGSVLVFDPNLADRQNGNGWITIKRNRLIPIEYAEKYITGMSKTEKNKIKERLTLVEAGWETSDGLVFYNVDEAIEHEKLVVKIKEERY